ncbi:hypothetical protein C810_01383 [Lachnospiraceae bacterium A2]|jgi:hypothetical protein|nr:hypothetical protein C810_01383 [Lachnospiraceae bacterium A2]
MRDKSLEFVKKRIESGVCNGMEKDKYNHLYEVDFLKISEQIKFSNTVKVSENLLEVELPFKDNKGTTISVTRNTEAEFDYMTVERCRCDGTFVFFIDLCKKILEKILKGETCYSPKIPKDAKEKLYKYNIRFEVGNFIFAEEYGEDFTTKEKPWMKSRFTVMLPIKCDFAEKQLA